MTKLRFKILPLLLAGLLMSVVGLFAVNAPVKADGEDNTITLSTFKVLDSAQVRVIEPEGMRFRVEISDQEKSDNLSENAVFGVIMLPERMLGENDLTLDTTDALVFSIKHWVSDYEKAGYSAYNAVLLGSDGVNFDESLYNEPIVVKGFVKDGEKVGYTANETMKSISHVAKLSLLAGNADTNGILSKLSATATATVSVNDGKALSPSLVYDSVVKVSDLPITSDKYVVTYDSDAPAVATVDSATGKVTAVNEGTAKITATISHVSSGVESIVAETIVTVSPKDKVAVSKKALFDAYSDSSYVVGDKVDVSGAIVSATLANDDNTYTSADGTFAKADVATGYYTLTVETATTAYVAEAIVADKVITTKAEFANWPYYIRPANWSQNSAAYTYSASRGYTLQDANVYDGLVVLGADIDYGGDEYFNELMGNPGNVDLNVGVMADGTMSSNPTADGATKFAWGYTARFEGIFDGLGHTIYNIVPKYYSSPVFAFFMNGTIQNVAVTQITHKHTTVNNYVAIGYGSVIGRAHTDSVLSNIFMEGRFAYTMPSQRDRTGFIGQFTDCANARNLVAVVTYMPNGDMSNNSTIQNTVTGYGNTVNESGSVHSILGGAGFTTGNGHNYDTIPEFYGQWMYKVGSTLYRNYFNKMDANLWTSTSGFPVMNSALNHLSDLDLTAFYGEEQTLSVPKGDSVVIGAATKEGSGANKQVNYWNFEVEDIAGVTFDSTNRTLSVDATVPAGTKIKVTATNQLNTNQKVEIELEVILPVVELDQKLFSKYDETDGTYNFDYLEGDIVSLSLVDDATQDGYNYESSSVAVGDIPVGYYSVSVETATKIYKFKAIFADKVVTTAEEFANWPQYIRPDNWSWGSGFSGSTKANAYISDNTYTGFVVLGADINMNGAEYINELFYNLNKITIGLNSDYQFTTNEEEMAIHPAHPKWGKMKFDGGYCAEFAGTFDGLGHTVYNFHIDKPYAGIFGFRVASTGVVKNLGVTQVTLNYSADGSNANFKYQTSTLAGYMWGRASNIFVEGAMNFVNSGQTRSSLGFGDVQDGTYIDGVAYTPYAENVVAVVTYSPSGQKGDWGNSRVTAMCYGAPDAGVVLGLASGDTVSAIGDGTVLNSTISAYAGKNFSMLDSNLWDVSSGFPVFKSAIGKLSTLNLEAVNASSEKVTTVSAEETVTIQSVALSASGVNSQMNYWTFEVDGNATLDLTDVLNGVKLTVNAGVASGTVITVTATNQLDTNQKVTLTLTVA